MQASIIVAVGASAGGLDAYKKLLASLPAEHDLTFIFVQHLQPDYPSLLVELLGSSTNIPVLEAAEGMLLEPRHLYVIPPGRYLGLNGAVFHLTAPSGQGGVRLPFDHLLLSLASSLGSRAACVVLTGSGADGSIGLKAVKEHGGLVVVQDPEDAEHDGMPRSAIATGAVDLVLPLAGIARSLVDYSRHKSSWLAREQADETKRSPTWLADVLAVLRAHTAHDFTSYKAGTLQRRVERRMAMMSVSADDAGRYLELLHDDPAECELLAKDLLINVTAFFRDAAVFSLLEKTVIPELLGNQPRDRPLRVWVAGCSTGEEAYSLAMVFREEIARAGSGLRLQIFASDVDSDAVTRARDGLYPESIEAEISAERLERFFTKEGRHYRVSTELRGSVVFAVQDVLADPPFSRLDFISCRNLLIYLLPEAQTKAIGFFHFALRAGGLLLLGSSENTGDGASLFEPVAKVERLYRNAGRSRPQELRFVASPVDNVRVPWSRAAVQPSIRPPAIADLCRRMLLEKYAPAAVLVNRRHECLYFVGATDDYLRVAPGHALHDVIDMARKGVRTKLRAAMQASWTDKTPTTTEGQLRLNGRSHGFAITVHPVAEGGEDFRLICFTDLPRRKARNHRRPTETEVTRIAELEYELVQTRAELQATLRSVEAATDEHRAILEEGRSANEEYQATNEELLTSKEELQSLNEELTALNGQLQETLQQQRTTANDLQNVLFSTDVATLFLDRNLCIRFFTPATKRLFNVIPSDIGRPLADLAALAGDPSLLADAGHVVSTSGSVEREIEPSDGAWFLRRIVPYRTKGQSIEGVVITFVDMSERKKTALALEAANKEAQAANLAKSRFLAAASHDLRQPLQTLSLLHALLSELLVDGEPHELAGRIGASLTSMSDMLNALLDINQIEAGTVRAEISTFPINDLFARLRDELDFHAKLRGLSLRIVPSKQSVRSDPALLEQVLRNLLSNAIKYTKRGRVLLGCRRRGGMLAIEVWDTGIGIRADHVQAIFDEYYQVGNLNHERRQGLGLGLSIVQRLCGVLGHRVRVRSTLGKGSAFAIDVMLPPAGMTPVARPAPIRLEGRTRQDGVILSVEDDPEVSELLAEVLQAEGYGVISMPDARSALEWAATAGPRLDLILTDYNLPSDTNGVQLVEKMRERFFPDLPAIILSGDISTDTARAIAHSNCVQLVKPIARTELTHAVQRVLAREGAYEGIASLL